MTRVNLEDHYILSSIFLESGLVITLQNSLDVHDRRVLEITEIAGFIDQRVSDKFMTLRIDDGGGSYAFDLSIRLRRKEIASYPEVFFFTDAKEADFCFRACARSVIFREWNDKDVWPK